MNRLKTPKQNKELSHCLRAIEKKLGWGQSDKWSSYDFDKLSEAIFQETGTKLSANTLKRIWRQAAIQIPPEHHHIKRSGRIPGL